MVCGSQVAPLPSDTRRSLTGGIPTGTAAPVVRAPYPQPWNDTTYQLPESRPIYTSPVREESVGVIGGVTTVSTIVSQETLPAFVPEREDLAVARTPPLPQGSPPDSPPPLLPSEPPPPTPQLQPSPLPSGPPPPTP